MNSFKRELNSLEDTTQLARELATQLKPRQIILLEGPLGVGKTQFVRALIEVLNESSANINEVCSPSFSIHNVYQTTQGEVDHLDLYRLQNEDELESTGFWDLFSKEQGLVLIEWPHLLDIRMLPRGWNQIRFIFSFNSQDKRSVEFRTN